MKYVFISDIHGSINQLEKCIQLLEIEKADKLVILGDTASSFSEGDIFLMAQMLNSIKSKVEVIRGNCDTHDFENALDFEIFDDDILYVNGKLVSVEHGHIHDFYHLPLNCGDIFIQGHTHIPQLLVQGGRILANPGSVTRPRGTDLRCYLLLDEENISLKTLEKGDFIKKVNINLE